MDDPNFGVLDFLDTFNAHSGYGTMRRWSFRADRRLGFAHLLVGGFVGGRMVRKKIFLNVFLEASLQRAAFGEQEAGGCDG